MKNRSDLQIAQQTMFHDIGSARRAENIVTDLLKRYRHFLYKVDGDNLHDTLNKVIKLEFETKRAAILARRKQLEKGSQT